MGEWAPTGASKPEPCPESGFRCPGRSGDDVNVPPGSKPIIVNAGDTTEKVEVETVTFDLALDLNPGDFDAQMEQRLVERLALLYGVNASMISVEATIANNGRRLTSTLAPTSAAAVLASTLDATTFAASGASTAVAADAADADDDDGDDLLRRLSHEGTAHSSLLLTVTILVPPPEPEAAADGGQPDGGSDPPPAADGTAGGSAGSTPAVSSERMKEEAQLFARRVGALNTGNFSQGTFAHTNFSLGVCAYLFNVTGANSTIVSDAQVNTITKEVSVSCPKGYWCSAGLTVACTQGSYNDLFDQNYAGACKPCPKGITTVYDAAISAGECSVIDLDYFTTSFCSPGTYDTAPAWSAGAMCAQCEASMLCGENASALTLATVPLRPHHWRLSNLTAKTYDCGDASACLGGADSSAYCKEGHQGPRCKWCSDSSRYYDAETASCKECGSVAEHVLKQAAVLVGMAFALFLLRLALLRSPRLLASSWGKLAQLMILAQQCGLQAK